MGEIDFSRLKSLLMGRMFATWVSYLVKALPLFLLPPFIFTRLAPEEAAIWFIFITIQGTQLLMSASTEQPMMRGFAYALGGASQVRDIGNFAPTSQREPNIVLLSRVWSAGAIIQILIGMATLVLLGALGVWSAAPLISSLPPNQGLWIALAVFVVGGALRAYGSLQASYLVGVDRIPVLRWSEAVFWLIAFTSTLSTLLAGGGLLAMAVAYQMPLALNIGWNAWLCHCDHRTRSGFQTGLRVDRDIMAQMWPSIWRTGLGITIFIGATQGVALYFATVGKPQEVAAFLFAMSLIRPLGQFAQVPFITKLPLLARLQARGERNAQRQIVERSMMLSYVLHAAMVLGVGVALWLLGSLVEVPIVLWLLIGLAGLIERVGSMHLQLYSSTNHVVIHWANGLTAVAYVGLSAMLLPSIDVYAFPFAQIVTLAFIYAPIGMIKSYKEFGLHFPVFELRTSCIPLLVISLSIAGFGWFN